MKEKRKFQPVRHERMPDSVTLSCRLWHAICAIPKIDDRNLTAWTDAIARAVATLCPDGLYVYGKQWKDEGRCEYLVNQCWRQHYISKSEALYIPGAIVLAMECEWIENPRDQLHDFSKLLDLRPPLALYVAGLSNWSKRIDAVVTCAIFTKMHASFSGELVLYFFDRRDPAQNFQVWRIARRPGAAEIEGPNDLGKFMKAGGCDKVQC